MLRGPARPERNEEPEPRAIAVPPRGRCTRWEPGFPASGREVGKLVASEVHWLVSVFELSYNHADVVEDR